MAKRKDEQRRAVEEMWSQTAQARSESPLRGWLDLELVLREYVNRKQTGDGETNWLVGLCSRLRIPSESRWLSLGCGAGPTEIFAASQGLFRQMDAFDAAPGAIDVARATAASQGITNIEFAVAGFEDFPAPPAAYDVVIMVMSLHHAMKLDRTLARVSTALKPDGYLLINEYIGPNQFAFTDLQLEVVRKLLGALPERLRQDIVTGELKSQYVRLPREHWERWDPSEAVHSAEIVEALERRFRVVDRRDYGGTLLNLLLEHIVHNFNPDDPDDVAFIRLLAVTEDLLIRNGVLPSDFTVMAVQNRESRWAGLRRRLSGR